MQLVRTPRRLTPVLLLSFAGMLAPATLRAQEEEAPAADPKDVLVKTDGEKVQNVAVLQATTDLIKYTKDGEEYDLPTSSIVAIEFGDLSNEFKSGMASYDAGQTLEAAQMFGEAATKSDRPVVQTEARFRAARSLAASARADASRATPAADACKAFVDANPDSYRLPEALLLLGSSQALASDHDGAIATFTQLSDDAAAKGWGALWTARARLQRALAEISADKADDARSSFQAAASAAGSALASGATGSQVTELKAIQRSATVGEGEAYIAGGDFDRAIAFYNGLGGKPSSGSTAMYAASQAGLGQALYHSSKVEEAKDEPSPEAIAKLRKAQRALAAASVFDSAGGDTSAKANYYMALSLLGLGAARESEDVQGRAQRYLEFTIAGYPTSRWAALARERLGR